MNEQLSFLHERTFDGKIESAIKLLKEFEESAIYRNSVGYVVGYSGARIAMYYLIYLGVQTFVSM